MRHFLTLLLLLGILGVLGGCACGDGEEWRYFIAAASTRQDPSLEECTVPAATWAIFPGSGTTQSLQELERRILTEWLPSPALHHYHQRSRRNGVQN